MTSMTLSSHIFLAFKAESMWFMVKS